MKQNTSDFESLVARRYGGDFDSAVQDVLKNEDEPVITRYVKSLNRAKQNQFFKGYKKIHEPGVSRRIKDGYP